MTLTYLKLIFGVVIGLFVLVSAYLVIFTPKMRKPAIAALCILVVVVLVYIFGGVVYTITSWENAGPCLAIAAGSAINAFITIWCHGTGKQDEEKKDK